MGRYKSEDLTDTIIDYSDYDQVIHDDSAIEYRQIADFPNYYVGENGDVLTMRKRTGHFHKLATWPNQYGHQYVQLTDEKYNKKISVHRLVAEAFLPNPDGYPVVRHLDSNPLNNCKENLAWGTQKDNRDDMIALDNDFHKEVYCYETDTVYRTGAEAAEDLNVSKSLITVCCQGKVHSINNGLHLCYLEDKEKMLSNLYSWISKNGNQKPIQSYNLLTKEKRYFKSRKEASEALGIPDSGISNVIAWRLNHTCGYLFEEVEDEDLAKCY